MSKFFLAVCRTLRIETRESTPYHPQTNGQVERYNRTIVKQIRHYVADNPRMWDELLPILTYAYNTQPHRSTGIAPFEMVIPRRIPNLTVHSVPPGVSIQAHGTTTDGSPLSVKRSFMARLRKTIPKVAEALRKTQQRYKKTYDRNLAKRNQDIKVGDYVYVRSHQREHKLESLTVGPFLVVDLDDKTFVVVQGDEENRIPGIKRRPRRARTPWGRQRRHRMPCSATKSTSPHDRPLKMITSSTSWSACAASTESIKLACVGGDTTAMRTTGRR